MSLEGQLSPGVQLQTDQSAAAMDESTDAEIVSHASAGLSSERAFVVLRYSLIIATAYLVLAESGFTAPPPLVVLILAGALATNVLVANLPGRIVTLPHISATIIVADTVWITAVLVRSTELSSDLLFLYSFVLLLAAIGESLQLIAIGALVVCAGYLYFLSRSGLPFPWSSQALMRVPFMFTVAIFYAYMTDRIRRVRRLASARAHTVARLERARAALEREVAERKRALNELEESMAAQRRLEREILNTSEEEQRRIGRDLHDGLGQDLTGIGFASRVLERKLRSRSVEEWSDAGRIAELVNDAIDKTRALARGLHPVEIGEDGLPIALKALAEGTGKMFGIACVFTSRGEAPLVREEITTHLYRIAQEAVHNAVRHSRSPCVRIDLSVRGDQLVLEVTDDGCGFSGAATAGGGLGVQIMHYRARLIGAELRIRQLESGGTSVQCALSSDDRDRDGAPGQIERDGSTTTD